MEPGQSLKRFCVEYTITHKREFRAIDEAQIRSILNESNRAEIISIQELGDEEDLS